MSLESLDKNDLLSILAIYSTESEQPIFMVDAVFRVFYANLAFAKFVGKELQSITGVDFGDALGCGNMAKDHKNCAFTSYCRTCEIRKNLHLVFNNQIERVQFELVREFLLNGETISRHLQLTLLSVVISQKRKVVCLISDKGDQDLIQLLTQPLAVI